MVITLWGYWLISFREVREKLFYRNLIVMKNFMVDWIQQKIFKSLQLIIYESNTY